MIDLEDAFIAEARRQGWQPNKSDMTELAITMAGSQVESDSIVLPSGHSIRVRDAVKSIRAGRASRAETEILPPTGTITERMRREIQQSRQSRPLPNDWEAVRATKSGLTASMMDELAAGFEGHTPQRHAVATK